MAKRKITVTVDAPLLDAIEALGVENLSALVSAALATEIETLGHHASLGRLLNEWDSTYGPVSEADLAAATAAFAELDGVSKSRVA